MRVLARIVYVLCAAGMCVPGALGQKVGSTSMQFLKVMPCARATAMGDAYSVLASGAEALFWNPGGLALVEDQEFSLTYVDWIFDARQGALSYATSLGEIGAVGAQVQYVDFGTFEETSALPPFIKNVDEPGKTGRSFRPFSYLFGLTYAKNMTDRFSVGLGVKFAYESLFDGGPVFAQVNQNASETVNTWANGLLFDFGVRYNTGFRSIQVGASVQNFGADVKYAKESNAVPLLFRFGIAANVVGPDAIFLPQDGNRLTVAFDLFQPNDYTQQAHAGVEYEYAEAFALRGGYKFNYDYEGITVGGGIKHSLDAILFSLDYSYGSIGPYLGSVHRISLGAGL